jgi:phage tail-like protein
MARRDPYGAFNFLVEIGGGETAAGFAECSGLATETEVIEYREGGDFATRKLPGLTKHSNVTLKRGLIGDPTLWRWRKAIVDGELDRRGVTIVLLDQARKPVVRFHLSNAWPCKWEGPTLNAKANDVAIETLELAHEGLDVEFDS